MTAAEQKLVDSALEYDRKPTSMNEEVMQAAIEGVKAERKALAAQKLIEGLTFLYNADRASMSVNVRDLFTAYRKNVGLA